MSTNKDIVFEIDYSNNEKDKEFIRELLLPNILIISLITIPILIIKRKEYFNEFHPSYIVLGLFFVFLFLWLLINYKTNKVTKLILDSNYLNIYFSSKKQKKNINLLYSSVNIELEEVRNYRSFLVEIKIIITDKLKKEEYAISDKYWTYKQIEDIYKELKTIKKETISEEEQATLLQLQIVNNTRNVG